MLGYSHLANLNTVLLRYIAPISPFKSPPLQSLSFMNSGPALVENFFNEQTEQSQVKTAIVTKYFWAWANVILSYQKRNNLAGKIAYLDLFAGPGRYADGNKSTPLLILEEAIADETRRNCLVTLFNDGSADNTSNLTAAIDAIPGIEKMKYKPQIRTNEVGEEIVKMFEKMKLIPTLFFVDPWGYKGLSLRLINSVLKDWACECIFFFNYNRVNMGINNDAVKEHMEALFGPDRSGPIREKLESLNPDDREMTIIEEICEALIGMGGKYTLPFRFRNAKGNRTSHHLIFVSKHPLGYDIMKEVMAKESSKTEQGVPTFEYNTASDKQKLLFELARPLDDLEDMLLEEYDGRQMMMMQIFEDHNYGRRYIKKNYKDALLKMEIAGKVTTDKPYTTRRKVKGAYSFGDDVKVMFPTQGGSK